MNISKANHSKIYIMCYYDTKNAFITNRIIKHEIIIVFILFRGIKYFI